MRQLRAARFVIAVIAASVASAAAQDWAFPSSPLRPAPVPQAVSEYAERLFQAGLAEQRAQAIGAEAGLFADRMAAVYLEQGSGPDWRAAVGRIHDPGRVSALILGAIEARLEADAPFDRRLPAAIAATGVTSVSDGHGLELAARIELTRPGALEAAVLRLKAASDRRAPELAAIRRLMADTDPAATLLSAEMNRELAFARGFAAAGGFEFPTSLDDVAGDLMLKLPEMRSEAMARARIVAFTAFAPLGASAIDHVAAARQAPEGRALEALMLRAEADVLDFLAEESGRAAAQRLRGTPL